MLETLFEFGIFTSTSMFVKTKKISFYLILHMKNTNFEVTSLGAQIDTQAAIHHKLSQVVICELVEPLFWCFYRPQSFSSEQETNRCTFYHNTWKDSKVEAFDPLI